MMAINNIYYVFFAMVLPLAFDFRSIEEGGAGFFQYAIFLNYLIISVYIFNIKPTYFDNYSVKIFYLVVAFCAVGFIRGIDFYRIISTAAPIFMFCLGLMVGGKILLSVGMRQFLVVMIKIGSVSVIFSIFYAWIFSGIDINTVRYQIISPVAIPYISLVLFYYFLYGSVGIFDRMCLFICFLTLFFSITRSIIMAAFLISFISFFLAQWCKKTKNILGAMSYMLAKSLFILFLVTFFWGLIDQDSFGVVFERWVDRSTGRNFDFDLTVVTRLAEIENQMNAVGASLVKTLFGMGLGAEYSYYSEYIDLLIYSGAYSYENLLFKREFVVGHNFYAYSIFSGGVIFGGAFLFFIFKIAFDSFFYIVARKDGEGLFYVSLTLLGVCSLFLISIGGNPLGPRISSAYLGLLISSGLFFLNGRDSVAKIKPS